MKINWKRWKVPGALTATGSQSRPSGTEQFRASPVRILAGFLLSPVLAGMGAAVLRKLDDPEWHQWFDLAMATAGGGYLAIGTLGAPVFYFLARKGKLGLSHLMTAGYVVGCVVPAVIFALIQMTFAGDITLADSEGAKTVLHGHFTSHAYYHFAVLLMEAGTAGASVGLVFWLVAVMEVPNRFVSRLQSSAWLLVLGLFAAAIGTFTVQYIDARNAAENFRQGPPNRGRPHVEVCSEFPKTPPADVLESTTPSPTLLAGARRGDADSQLRLALCYDRRQTYYSLTGNYKEAVQWYRKAAEQGSLEAQHYLGIHYERGAGVRRDYQEAYFWLSLAAYYGDLDTDAERREIAGHLTPAQVMAVQRRVRALHQILTPNGPAFRIDIHELKAKAEKAGDAGSQGRLGVLYARGEDIRQDYVEAAKWLRKAAEQGNDDAQSDLGALYMSGHGVMKDYREACFWLTLAQRSGNETAQALLDKAARRLTPAQMRSLQKRAFDWRPQPNILEEREVRKNCELRYQSFTNMTGCALRSGGCVEQCVQRQRETRPRSVTGLCPADQTASLKAGLFCQASPAPAYTPRPPFRDEKLQKLEAERGYIGAQSALAFRYFYGKDGIARDYSEAYFWFAVTAKTTCHPGMTYCHQMGGSSPNLCRVNREKGCRDAAAMRDIAAQHLSANQISVVRKRVRAWTPLLVMPGDWRYRAAGPFWNIPLGMGAAPEQVPAVIHPDSNGPLRARWPSTTAVPAPATKP